MFTFVQTRMKFRKLIQRNKRTPVAKQIMPSETDVAASAISGRTDGQIGWSPGGVKYRAAYAANNAV